MPMLGLGTWQNDDPEQCVETVRTALEMGYRYIDTAQAYDNETSVGEGIRASAVDRDEVFLATKLWYDQLDRDTIVESAQSSVDRLGVDTIELLYPHWPAGSYDAEETMDGFAELVDTGVIERIGLSNFTPELIDEARSVSDEPIFALQVECHPLLQQEQLREYCADAGIELVAYSPLARGAVFDVPEIEEIAQKHGVSQAQVSLAWLGEHGITAIPKATGQEHLRDNLAAATLELDAEDVQAIDDIDREERQINPSFAPDSW
ncbi:aldo/keto reductase [Halocatena pleomorpha]|uniref:Aldo/keto reductase n=2 Tax=Halocatena pleomorpha TaxID=1785090 RepID=A0A3P3RJR7_9EURY|nr:aldo/keto reductase [Halocatena pleomorpha]